MWVKCAGDPSLFCIPPGHGEGLATVARGLHGVAADVLQPRLKRPLAYLQMWVETVEFTNRVHPVADGRGWSEGRSDTGVDEALMWCCWTLFTATEDKRQITLSSSFTSRTFRLPPFGSRPSWLQQVLSWVSFTNIWFQNVKTNNTILIKIICCFCLVSSLALPFYLNAINYFFLNQLSTKCWLVKECHTLFSYVSLYHLKNKHHVSTSLQSTFNHPSH